MKEEERPAAPGGTSPEGRSRDGPGRPEAAARPETADLVAEGPRLPPDHILFSDFRIRMGRVATNVGWLSIAVIFLSSLLPPHREIVPVETIWLFLIGGAAGNGLTYFLPRERFIRSPWSDWGFYGWSASLLIFVSVLIFLNGGFANDLYIIYLLAILFTVATCDVWAHWLIMLLATSSYLLVINLSQDGVDLSDLVLRVFGFLGVGVLGSVVAREQHNETRKHAFQEGLNFHLYEEVKKKDAIRRVLLEKVITAQEDERNRIARELHDETSQALTALVLGMDNLARNLAEGGAGAKEKVAKIRAQTLETLNSIRGLAYRLRPLSLDDLGLVPALRSLAEDQAATYGWKIDLRTAGLDDRLPPSVETAVFRIVQEAITNAARHARAGQVSIRLEQKGRELLINVQDDGMGFEMSRIRRSGGGLGLLGMQERAELLGGELKIDSAPGKGTRIEVKIPLERSVSEDGSDQGSDRG